MNWAGVQKLPVIFILENNQYAYSTPLDQQFAVNPVERAAAYGFPGVSADGNDPEAMFEVVRQARERALAGEGPTLVEAVTMRMHGHAAHDDMKYVPTDAGRGVAREGPDRPPGRAAWRRSASTRRPSATSVKAEIDAAVERGAAVARSPTPTPSWTACSPTSPSLLEDGNAPWSGFRS